MSNKDITIESSKALSDLSFSYTHLPIGGKEIPCPYWMNKIKLGIIGPYGGKGTPEQIVETVEYEAKKDNFDLNLATDSEILSFMKNKKIGVDCSGFVFWMLNALDLEKGGDGIANDIHGSQGKFVAARANVAMLTDERIAKPVELENVKVGDMIQLRGRKHLAIVTKLFKEADKLKEIEYSHSSGQTQDSVVHSAIIEITNLEDSLGRQIWKEKTQNGENYGSTCFREELGDGLKRLKIWT